MAIFSKLEGISSVSTAPSTLSQTPYLTTGGIRYVDSVTGSDSNSGLREEAPKATVFGAAGALSVTTDGVSDLIVCKSTHRETISSAYTFATPMTYVSIVGIGSGTARPTFTSAVAGVAITTAQVGTRFENLLFAASTAATTSRITITGAGCEVRDCQFNAGANDGTDQVLINGAADVSVVGCGFTVTAAGGSGSQTALRVIGASPRLFVEDVTINGGSAGWNGTAFLINSADVDGFRVRNLTLSNYSEWANGTSGSRGYVSGITADATSHWAWTE